MRKVEAATLADIPKTLAAIQAAGEFGFDLETTGIDPLSDQIKSVTLAVGMKPDECWYFPLRGTGGVSQVQVFRELAPVLSDPAKTAVGSGLKFDIKFCRVNGVEIKTKLADTQIAHWLLDENAKEHGLKPVVASVLGVDLMDWKDAVKFDGDLFDGNKWLQYAVDDARYVLKLWKTLRPRLKKEKLEKVFETLEMDVVRMIADMEMAGIMIDVPGLREYQKVLTAEVAAAVEQACGLAGRRFDVGSPQQVSDILFGALGIQAPEGVFAGKQGFISTDDDVLEKLGEVPFVSAVLRFRKANKLLTTYVRPYLDRVQPTGRIHAQFNHTGTITGRWSSKEPNLQNIPAKEHTIKRYFVAPPGKVLIDGDFNQIEFRMAGHFAMLYLGWSKIAEAYKEGKDLHAKTMTDLGFDKLHPDDPTLARRKAKVVNFGFIFGRGEKSFAEDNKLPLETARKWRNGFHNANPELKKMRDVCGQLLEEQGYITTLTNRRRRFSEWKGKSDAFLKMLAQKEAWPEERLEHEKRALWWQGWVAWNSLVQGSTADYVKVTMWKSVV